MFNKNHLLYPKLFELFQTADEFTYKKRAAIYTKNSIASRVFLITKGAVKIYDYHNRYRRTKAIWYQNDFFGFDGILGRDRYTEYAEVLTKTLELQSIEISQFENRLKAEYGICKEFFNCLEARYKFCHRTFYKRSHDSREVLIIDYLENLAMKIGVRIGFEILIPIVATHQDIADLLGVSRQTVTTVLNILKKENAIYYSRSRIIIRNPEGKIRQ
jgi:CRP/FNR family cyclic AMP-dependent transcriptional regulator